MAITGFWGVSFLSKLVVVLNGTICQPKKPM